MIEFHFIIYKVISTDITCVVLFYFYRLITVFFVIMNVYYMYFIIIFNAKMWKCFYYFSEQYIMLKNALSMSLILWWWLKRLNPTMYSFLMQEWKTEGNYCTDVILMFCTKDYLEIRHGCSRCQNPYADFIAQYWS